MANVVHTMESRASFHFKLVLLGNAGVGKSCIVVRFTRDEFVEDSDTTIGAAFLTKTLSLEDAQVKIEIWDTAGQERYRSLAPMYYRGAQAAVVVFDLTSRESLDGAKQWVKELQRRADQNMVIALAGNKCDLVARRKVDSEEAAGYARENGLLYVETSAKDATGIEKLFVDVAKRVPRTGSSLKPDVVLLDGGKSAPRPAGSAGSSGGGGCC